MTIRCERKSALSIRRMKAGRLLHGLLVAGLILSTPAVTARGVESAVPPASVQAASRYNHNYDIFHAVQARHGMVASEHHLASEVGLKILQKGGNAVDAAVAVGFALAVVLPNAGNLGGGGFLLLHDAASGRSHALDFRETAPAAAHRDMYLDADGQVVDSASIHGHAAVGVPGTVAGLQQALEKWGSLSLAEVVEPAIRLAEQGFPVGPALAGMLARQQQQLARWPSTRRIFFNGDRPLQEGERLLQKDLAKSLRRIAKQGSKAFYEGEIAASIVREMQKHGGLIDRADLASYRAVEREPIRGRYRGYEIISMPPPSSGGIHILQILNILEQFPLAGQGANSAETIRQIAEAAKLAYADRAEFLGDPDFVQIPQEGLISKAYADKLAQGIAAGTIRPSAEIRAGQPAAFESEQTTHFSVADKQGNLVGVTYTLNLNFGSGIVAEGTGILLNNEMDDFSIKPGVPNVYGLVGGEANAVAGGKRPLSSMSPTLVLKEGRPWLVTGSPGGSMIITTLLQTLLNAIDFGMNPAENAASPRVHHQWQPDVLRVEKGLSPDTLRLLEEFGYDVRIQATMGSTQTIQRDAGMYYGYSDPRSVEGATLGY